MDTPGIQNQRDRLGQWMRGQVDETLESADLIYGMVFPRLPETEEREFVARFEKSRVPVFLLINQIDRIRKPEILPIIDAYQKLFSFKEIIPISAVQGDNQSILIEKTFQILPENPAYFPEDLLTDQTERIIAGEMIREKVFRFTGEEIPYAAAVQVDNFKERENGLVDVSATIFVERESQKAIVIGKKGLKLKEIGQASRVQIEKFLGRKVFLQLWVKTLPDWKKDPAALKRLGYQ